MLLTCKPGCTGKKGTTTGSVDLSTDEVVCEYCGDNLPVSKFAKQSMKSAGDVVKPKKAAYRFKCETCVTMKEVEIISGVIKGISCKNDCKFNVSKFALTAMNTIKNNKESDE